MKKTLLVTILFLFISLSTSINAQDEVVTSSKEKMTVEKRNLLFSKYKSAWQVGVFGGTSTLLGDINPSFLYGGSPALPGHNFGVFVSKSWTYLFSTRLKYSTMVMLNNDAVVSTLTSNQYGSLANHSSGLNGYNPGQLFFHNSRTQAHEISLDLVFSLGNINFNKERSSVVFKLFPSIGGLFYQTFHDHFDANGNPYDYGSLENLNNLNTGKRGTVYKDLAAMRDGKYETKAEEHSVSNENQINGYNPRIVFGLGAGVAFRVTDFLSIDIETKQMLTGDDLIDGVQWQEPRIAGSNTGNKTNANDAYNQTTVGLTFSLINKKHAESKNMDNPLAGTDAFTTKKDLEASGSSTNQELDSANLEIQEKIGTLENQINDLEKLIKTKNLEQEIKTKELIEQQIEKTKNESAGENTSTSMNNSVANDVSSIVGKNVSASEINQSKNNSASSSQGATIMNSTSSQTNENDVYAALLDGAVEADYFLITGSFRVKSNAITDQANWLSKGYKTVIMRDVKQSLYRLAIDYTNDYASALIMLEKYKKTVNPDIWIIRSK